MSMPEELKMTRTSRTRKRAALAGAGLLFLTGAAGCAADQSAANDDPAGVDTAPAPTEEVTESAAPSAEPDVVTSFSDTFDDDANLWALPPGPQGTTTVAGGDFVWESKQPMLRPHVLAGSLIEAFDAGRVEMTDVRVTATVTPQRGAPAFGLFCREVPDTDADFQWYEFVVRDGYSAIRLADDAGHLEPLEEGNATVTLGKQLSLQATCTDQADGSASLTLSFDGEELLRTEVSEPLGNGIAGLQAYDASAEESDEMLLLAWHDFSVEPAG
jgi:hypothetical protein